MEKTRRRQAAGRALVLSLVFAAACESGDEAAPLASAVDICEHTASGGAPPCATEAVLSLVERAAQNAVKCDDRIPVYENGKHVAEICPEAAQLAGHTLLDLSDEWVPHVLKGEDGKRVPYAETYVKLANESLGEDADWDRALHDRFFELYGIFPSVSLSSRRLADKKRHSCHDAVPDDGLKALDEALNTWRPLEEQQDEMAQARSLEKLLRMAAGALKKKSIDELAKSKTWGARYRHYKKLTARGRAVAQMQEHLRCEGLLDKAQTGLLDRPTIDAMEAYHRRHMLVSWQLDDETRTTLLTDSRELDFRTLLRTLRERVIDATGLIEDGSATGERSKVAGRMLDARAFLSTPKTTGESSGEGAPDLVSSATDAAARALGWVGPAEARAFLAKKPVPTRVAVKLPPLPAYHREHMDLHAVVDRGDVWYDFPYTPSGELNMQLVENRPSLTLYVKHEGRDIALVRWPTTIGGWQPERIENGRIYLVYKESPAGERIWRDIVAEPRWIPPENTPERDIMRPRGGVGGWALRNDTFGPHYASAYGLVMMVHHRVDGKNMTDQGIRSHGSVSYKSILDGESHGCHRLHNHRAVRLASFLLEHRTHEVRGPIPVGYTRYFEWRGRTKKLDFDSRGFRYELTPPVPVEVTRGRIMSRTAAPAQPRELTERLRERYANPG